MESSQIFVPILSKNYAQSKWCLLEAAKMVEIAEGAQQKMRRIIPVFYHVDPSDVKDDGGLYQSAAKELQNSGKLEGRKVNECIDSLRTIGSISGFHLKKGTDENEAELISCICRDVEKLLGRVPFAVKPIGIDSQIDEVITMLEAQANGVCIVSICGMGGIGKTAIAKAITDKLFSEFDGCSFIEDVGAMAERQGLPSIQQKLICGVLNLKKESISIDTVDEGRNIIKQRLNSKRVLIVLDNIVQLDQLQQLSGDHICHKPKDLFGKGSKIIVTTRDKAVLLRYGLKEHQIYYPEELKHPWSLKLLYRHAFMHEPPSFELLDLAKEVAGIAGGLPLVLVTVGSVFAGLSTQDEWESELEKIRKNRGTSILEKLKWSYDGLDNDQKCVFLDIACFLIGAKRKRATYLWDDCSPGNAIRVLQERNLITIDDEDKFRMHDLIQEMGRWIVSKNRGPYTNSRLCCKNEESITSMNCKEKGKVEGIVLKMEEECTETNLTGKVFVDMPKLRLLHLNFVKFLEPKIEYFPRRLKWLQWRGCELESVTFDRTSFKNLAILDLSQSSIYKLTLKNEMDRLKVLDLSNCWYIEATPDFACTPKLEKLFLDDCGRLRDVHESICRLGNLTTLSMRDCEFVEELPEKHRCTIANLSKLEELNLQGCRRLQSLPRLPSSLKTLILQGCKLLKAVHGFQNLKSMELLDMDGCEKINFTLRSRLFEGKTFRHLEVLSASASKTLSEDEKISFIVPLNSPSNPLLLQQLQCYGDGSKSGNLSNIYIKVGIKDMEDNLVIYETIFSGYRDIDNEIDGQYGWCYTVSFSEYDDINFFPELYRPCSICVSTADNFSLISVHILLRSAHRWSRNYSKLIPVGENVANSRRISAEQNQPLPSMLSAECFTFEFDVLFRYVKEDLDTKFINNLYKALQQHGIGIFKGEYAESKRGECLLNCIERSAICIPIFSKRFSQSKWHLDSVAKMVELGKLVIPIYFQVPPSDIRDRKGVFGTYFSFHKNEDQRETVEGWIKALETVVKRCHQEFIYETNRYMEEELITVICNRISSMLNSATFRKMPIWLGVKDVIRMLEKDRDDVCRVGICGQSGVGKTTIAKAVYEQLSHEFDDSAFISSVWPFKLRRRQFVEQRVLIVFDDVDGLDQSRQIFDPDLSGKGSKIIAIAKDKGDLVHHAVKEDNIYFVPELNNLQSLRLLGYYAFKGKKPTAEIVELARKVTEFAGGLPLGVAVLGSLLSSMRTKEEWESMLEKLSSAPGEGIDKVLKVSMDALHPNQLQILFDIVCRLIGHEKEYATYMWEDCGYSATEAIEVLQQRSLISIDEEGRFRMHDKIRDMCRSMVEEGELKIWIENGLLVAFADWDDWWIDVLHSSFRRHSRPIPIEAMGNLRVLHLTNCIVNHNSLQPLKNLTWLWMERCEMLSWELINDGGILENLLVLQLHECQNRRLGKQDVAGAGNNHQEVFKKLKVLEIIRCSDVGKTSHDFSLMPSLVKLVIEYSWNFDQIPKSIWGLGKLEYLRITGWEMKKLLSSNISSCRTLALEECELLSKLPEGLGDLAALRELILRDYYELEEIPTSVAKLNHLRTLIVKNCWRLLLLPQLPSSLITLDASGCANLTRVANISSLKYLRTLNLDGCDVLQDVPGLENLKSLTFLKLPFHINQREEL